MFRFRSIRPLFLLDTDATGGATPPAPAEIPAAVLAHLPAGYASMPVVALEAMRDHLRADVVARKAALKTAAASGQASMEDLEAAQHLAAAADVLDRVIEEKSGADQALADGIDALPGDEPATPATDPATPAPEGGTATPPAGDPATPAAPAADGNPAPAPGTPGAPAAGDPAAPPAPAGDTPAPGSAEAIQAAADRLADVAREAVLAAAAGAGPSTPGADGQPTQVTVQGRTERLAALGEVWGNQRDTGTAMSFRELVNGSRPAGPRPEPGQAPLIPLDPRRDSIMAATAEGTMGQTFQLTDSPSHNDASIADAMEEHHARRMAALGSSDEAKRAAICDPPTIIRTAFVCGTTETPLRNSLVKMSAPSDNALSVQFRTPTSISAAQPGVGTFTPDDQAAIDRIDPDTWKPCVTITCPSYSIEQAVEWTACYEIDAWTQLSSPEAELDFVQAKDRAYARHTEGWHIRKLDTMLRPLTWAGTMGAIPETISAILAALVTGHYVERLEMTGMVVAGSPGLLAALITDEVRRAYGDGSASLAKVQNLVEETTGTQYLQLLDQPLKANGDWGDDPFMTLPAPGAGSASTLAKLSTVTFDLRIYDPSSIVSWSTGQAVFGEQITLDQARRNQRGFFQREFGSMFKPGCTPGYKIRITLCPDGSRGGFVTPGC